MMDNSGMKTRRVRKIQTLLEVKWVDFGYTEQFCIPRVTSVFFSSCDSVVGDSLEINQANRVSLSV